MIGPPGDVGPGRGAAAGGTRAYAPLRERWGSMTAKWSRIHRPVSLSHALLFVRVFMPGTSLIQACGAVGFANVAREGGSTRRARRDAPGGPLGADVGPEAPEHEEVVLRGERQKEAHVAVEAVVVGAVARRAVLVPEGVGLDGVEAVGPRLGEELGPHGRRRPRVVDGPRQQQHAAPVDEERPAVAGDAVGPALELAVAPDDARGGGGGEEEAEVGEDDHLCSRREDRGLLGSSSRS